MCVRACVRVCVRACVRMLSMVSDGSCLRPGKEKKSLFSDWMTWCQSCHHGGHSTHMQLWFR